MLIALSVNVDLEWTFSLRLVRVGEPIGIGELGLSGGGDPALWLLGGLPCLVGVTASDSERCGGVLGVRGLSGSIGERAGISDDEAD